MKKKLILPGVVCIMVCIVGITWYIVQTNREPAVAFSYMYQNSYYYSVWTIDQQGNIYRFHDNWTLTMDDYESRKQDENCQYIKTIDMETVKERYAFFRDIISDRHYKKNLYVEGDINLNIFRGTKRWYGYVFNWKGEEEHITIRDDGDQLYWSEDARMEVLADALTDLIREEIKEYDEYCYRLKLEEFLREEGIDHAQY